MSWFSGGKKGNLWDHKSGSSKIEDLHCLRKICHNLRGIWPRAKNDKRPEKCKQRANESRWGL